MILAGISKARQVSREEALKKVDRVNNKDRQHRLVVEYDRRSGPLLSTVLQTNYNQMVARDQRLGRIFPNPPRPAFKRGKNLRELLCRAKLPPVRAQVRTRAGDESARNGLSRCNKGTSRNVCIACPYITSHPSQIIKTVEIFNTGQKVEVEGLINCKTEGGFLCLVWSKK